MSPRLKTILVALGLIASIELISFVIWWQFFLVPVPAGTTTNQAILGRVLPQIADLLRSNRNVRRLVNGPLENINRQLPKPSAVANGGATLAQPVVDRPTDDLTPIQNGFGFYDSQEGKFYRLSPDGSTQTLITDRAFPGAESVTWSPTGQRAVVSFPDDAKIVYDFQRQQQFTLPKEAADFSFSPEGDQLVFKFLGRDEDDRFLTIAKSDGSEATFVEPIGDRAAQVTPVWSPNRQVVATFEKGATGDQQEIIFLGARGENFPSTVVAGRSFDPRWSPDGNTLLYTVRSRETADNPSLWLMDGRPDSLGQRQVNLGVETFVDKCAFGSSASVVYCAVPEYLPPGAGIFPELARGIPDDLYKIDLTSGLRSLVAQPTDAAGNANFSAADVVVSADERFLYFRDQVTGKLHQIRLK